MIRGFHSGPAPGRGMIGPMIGALLLALVAIVGCALPRTAVEPSLASQARATAKADIFN